MCACALHRERRSQERILIIRNAYVYICTAGESLKDTVTLDHPLIVSEKDAESNRPGSAYRPKTYPRRFTNSTVWSTFGRQRRHALPGLLRAQWINRYKSLCRDFLLANIIEMCGTQFTSKYFLTECVCVCMLHDREMTYYTRQRERKSQSR